MLSRGFYSRRATVWGEGGFVGAFWELFHLLDLLDGLCLPDGSGRGLEGLWPEFLGLGGEESNLPGVCLHLEVGAKRGPPRGSGHLWQWVRVVGHHRLRQVLLDVPQVLVVHLGWGGLTNRFCLLGIKRLEVLFETGWECIWIVPVQKWDVGRQEELRTGLDQCFYHRSHSGYPQSPPYITVTLLLS